jgi:hypothetical protein
MSYSMLASDAAWSRGAGGVVAVAQEFVTLDDFPYRLGYANTSHFCMTLLSKWSTVD